MSHATTVHSRLDTPESHKKKCCYKYGKKGHVSVLLEARPAQQFTAGGRGNKPAQLPRSTWAGVYLDWSGSKLRDGERTRRIGCV